jgi:hypothetical protein
MRAGVARGAGRGLRNWLIMDSMLAAACCADPAREMIGIQ